MNRLRCMIIPMTKRSATTRARTLATVSPSFIPSTSPPEPPIAFVPPAPQLSSIDKKVLSTLGTKPQTSLSDIIGHYIDQTGNVLDASLPYESRPSEDRRVAFEDGASSKELVTIAHCLKHGNEHKIALSSGFALNAPAPREGETLIVTCGHTLEQVGLPNSFLLS